MQVLFISLFFIGIIIFIVGYYTLYPVVEECNIDDDEILRKLLKKKEILKRNNYLLKTDDLTEYQFNQKPTEIYKDMFDRNSLSL